MKMKDMSDAALIEAGLIDEFVRRCGGKEFVVYRTNDGSRREYVGGIDSYDGDIDWTADPRFARIFGGEEWTRFWARPEYTTIVPEGLPLTTDSPIKRRHTSKQRSSKCRECSRTDRHTHCPECGSTEHSAAYCDNLG